ncbi:unnamed protein product [Laminaria digitata]
MEQQQLLQGDPHNRYLFVRDSQSSLPSSTSMPRQHAQVFERKWELGVVFEAQLKDAGGAATPYEMFRAAVGEFIGTLLFLFSVITIARLALPTADSSANVILIAFGFGLSIFGLVYIMADVSGANLNPAVSLGLLLGKRISVERFCVYLVAQILGALAGAGLATIFLDSTSGGFNALAEGIDAADAFAGEVLCTFLLVTTVFSATDGQVGHKFKHTGALLPLSIGFAVLLDHLIMIPVDGCSINPARSLATAITNNKWDDHWVFWVGPMLGGALATIVWEAILRPEQPVSQQKAIVEAGTV